MGYDSLDCRLNNTPFKLDNVQKIRHLNIDGGFDKEGNKIGYRKQLDKIGFHSIGEK
jgi:hypothetical protein